MKWTPGETKTIDYDRLVIATGGRPKMPPVPGIDLGGVTCLHSLGEADYLRRIRDERSVEKAVVVGGGLIGFEVCEALRLAGIEITVVEMLPQILNFLDWDLAKLVENHVRTKAANVITGNGVAAFLGENGSLQSVKLANGTELPCELAIVAVGVTPNVNLAREAGIAIGSLGGIAVDDKMRTSDPNIYAVGDCVECTSLITKSKVLAPFGDIANLQGRVAGQNVIEEDSAHFSGVTLTGICRIFDYAAGSTGLSAEAAAKAGFEVETATCSGLGSPDFMSGKLIVSRVVAEKGSGRILGYQAVGPGDVSKRVATMAVAIRGGLTVFDMIDIDLPYAPPFSQAFDQTIVAAHILENKLKGRMRGISAGDLKAMLDRNEGAFIVDTRSPQEYEQMRLGIGEVLIPLGALRSRLDELPQDKTRPIVLFCKISLRGYEAAAMLTAKGWENALVLEGGIMAWPYPREK